MAKQSVDNSIRVRVYPIIADDVEASVAYGWRRAHKHTSTPTEAQVCQEITNAVLNGLCEILDFD